MSSPTQRTLAECRKRDWTVQVVERFNPHARVRVDLFGVLDLVALTADSAILGIQACAAASASARRAKIDDEPRARRWIECGGRLEVWSWGKRSSAGRGSRKTWQLTVYAKQRDAVTGELGWVTLAEPVPA